MACFLFAMVFCQIIGKNALYANALNAENRSPNAYKVIISVKETSFVKSSSFTLSEIAEIQANGFLKETLDKVIIGTSPKPDQIKAYDQKKIISLIKKQRYLPKEMLINIPDRIYVKRLSQTISKKSIENYVALAVSNQFAGQEHTILSLSIKGLELMPKGDITFSGNVDNLVDRRGKFSIFVDILVDGIKEDRLNVTGLVAVYEKVAHLSKSMKKGETLSRSDLYFEKRNIFELDGNFIREYKPSENKILKTGLKKGAFVKESLLAEPFLVKKGDIVTLVAKNNNLLIVTSGICKDDGFENHLVRVENMRSGKLVRGLVKNKSRVEVVY